MTTQTDAILSLDIDGLEISEQVITGGFTWPTAGDGTTVPVGSGTLVKEPGDPQDGSLKVTLYKKTEEGGISRVLVEKAGLTVPYTYIENPQTPEEFKVTGELLVQPPPSPFNPAKYGRQDVELPIISATLAPAYVAP